MARILTILTNRGTYEGHGERTGLWLGELTHFVEVVEAAGHAVELASPAGGAVPLDPRSLGWLFTTANDRAKQADPGFVRTLAETRALRDVDVDAFGAIYFTGGHGTMFDFPSCPDFAPACARIHARGGIVASVCHGVGAMLALDTPETRALVAGQALTGYSDFEETLAGVRALVPFSLEDRLRGVGAIYEKALVPFTPYVRVSGRLVTGQNPQSTRAVARATVGLLR
jgi:putative intracellular protease/amidase